jgi:uncharacterized membrane protein
MGALTHSSALFGNIFILLTARLLKRLHLKKVTIWLSIFAFFVSSLVVYPIQTLAAAYINISPNSGSGQMVITLSGGDIPQI